MIQQTQLSISLTDLTQAKDSLPNIDFRLSLNEPTGRFFYDPWKIKSEFNGTVWERILNTLPAPIGEARLIQLKHGTCYMSHCDIDDRYHLNLEGQYSFLIDVDSEQMFSTPADGNWYTINTGIRHVAANFGSINRTQLVVRFLLNDVKLSEPVTVKIFPTCVNPRFEFDDIVSPWLHKMNKLHYLAEFTVLEEGVSFKLEHKCIEDLNVFSNKMFKIIVEK